MSSAATRTPADVARAVFDAVSKRDLDGIVAAGAPGYVDDFVAIGEIRGHDAVRAFFGELFAAFPDFTMTVDRIVADDTTAVVQWHAAGTFTGQIGLLPGLGSRADQALLAAFNAKTTLTQRVRDRRQRRSSRTR
jgi:predicted ester cyclase